MKNEYENRPGCAELCNRRAEADEISPKKILPRGDLAGNESKRFPWMAPMTRACKESGLSYKALRRLIEEGKVPCVRSGARILVNVDRLIDFLNVGEEVSG